MNRIAGSSNTIGKQLYTQVAHYRHKVFIEMLGWELETRNGEELDQFDRPDTLYVVSQDDDGNVNGCARLLPTSQPYLLGEIFPQLMNGAEVPRSDEIWEVSRFAAVDFNSRTMSALSQFSSEVAVELDRKSVV